jgi:dihydrofolate reductase
MRTVIYSMSVSLDGFIAGPGGDISWTAPDQELFEFHVQQTREIGAELMGRGLYETMLVWEDAETTMSGAAELEFARIWKAIPKMVFSTTLQRVEGNARLAGGDVAAEVAKLKEAPGARGAAAEVPRGAAAEVQGVLSVGGAGLAATLIKLDLIDEYRLFVLPVVVGGGTPYFPPTDAAIGLELLETRTFGSQVVYLRYRRSPRG